MSKHPGGRPKKYTDEVVADLIKKLEEYIEKSEMPLVCEFLYLHKIPNSMFYAIPRFSETLQLLKKKQKTALLLKGLSGDYNSAIAKLVLSANHGMSETTNQNLQANVTLDATIKQMSDKELDAEINKLK